MRPIYCGLALTFVGICSTIILSLVIHWFPTQVGPGFFIAHTFYMTLEYIAIFLIYSSLPLAITIEAYLYLKGRKIIKKISYATKKFPILVCLIYGVVIGNFSYMMGRRDFVVLVNPLGSGVSEIIYNYYLIPHWQRVLKPVGYENIPIVGPTGIITGYEKVPQYDFPIKSVVDLYIPISILSWGLVGVGFELGLWIYGRKSEAKGDERGNRRQGRQVP